MMAKILVESNEVERMSQMSLFKGNENEPDSKIGYWIAIVLIIIIAVIYLLNEYKVIQWQWV
jgi:hypothetical protein